MHAAAAQSSAVFESTDGATGVKDTFLPLSSNAMEAYAGVTVDAIDGSVAIAAPIDEATDAPEEATSAGAAATEEATTSAPEAATEAATGAPTVVASASFNVTVVAVRGGLGYACTCACGYTCLSCYETHLG